MPRYVALFRGINVGKAKRIAMADLRVLLGKLGYTDVQTLLNSGNAVFTGAAEPAGKHAERIRQAVLKKTGVDALVIVKSAKDMAAIIEGNELGAVATDPSRLLVAHDQRRQGAHVASRRWRAPIGATKGFTSANTPRTCGAPTGFSKARRWRRCSRASRAPAPRATGPRSTRFTRSWAKGD